jgi:flavin-binding protein dodecin
MWKTRPFRRWRRGQALLYWFPAQCAEDSPMTVAKVIELSSSSSKGIEDAVQAGLAKVSKTVKNIKSAWVNEIRAITGEDGSVIEWRVNMRINFIVE